MTKEERAAEKDFRPLWAKEDSGMSDQGQKTLDAIFPPDADEDLAPLNMVVPAWWETWEAYVGEGGASVTPGATVPKTWDEIASIAHDLAQNAYERAWRDCAQRVAEQLMPSIGVKAMIQQTDERGER